MALKTATTRSLKGLGQPLNPKEVSISNVEFIFQEELLSTDPEQLIGECQRLEQRAKNSLWLLGQRINKLHEIWIKNKKERWILFGQEVIAWEQVCRKHLKISPTNCHNFMSFYKNVSWEELDKMQITGHKAVLVGLIADRDKRRELDSIAFREQLSYRETNAKVREFRRSNSKETRGRKPEMAKVFAPQNLISYAIPEKKASIIAMDIPAEEMLVKPFDLGEYDALSLAFREDMIHGKDLRPHGLQMMALIKRLAGL